MKTFILILLCIQFTFEFLPFQNLLKGPQTNISSLKNLFGNIREPSTLLENIKAKNAETCSAPSKQAMIMPIAQKCRFGTPILQSKSQIEQKIQNFISKTRLKRLISRRRNKGRRPRRENPFNDQFFNFSPKKKFFK